MQQSSWGTTIACRRYVLNGMPFSVARGLGTRPRRRYSDRLVSCQTADGEDYRSGPQTGPTSHCCNADYTGLSHDSAALRRMIWLANAIMLPRAKGAQSPGVLQSLASCTSSPRTTELIICRMSTVSLSDACFVMLSHETNSISCG